MLKQVMDAIGAVLSRDSRGRCLLIPSDAEVEEIARTAIEAMREPTQEMLGAADNLPIIIDDEGPPPEKAWATMIDAALSKVDA